MSRIQFVIVQDRPKNVQKEITQNFLSLCQDCHIQRLFQDEGHVHGYRVSQFYSLIGLSASQSIELHIEEKSLFHEIKKDIEKHFPVLHQAPDLKTIEDITYSLHRLLESQEQRFPVECLRCKRPVWSIKPKSCPYCGDMVSENLKLCKKCDTVYVPAYSFCPECGVELVPTHSSIWDYTEPEAFFYGVKKEETEME